MTALDWSPRTRLVFGAGAVARLGELAREAGAARALLVTDPGVAAAGHAARAAASLADAGLDVRVHDDVRENPTTEDVDGVLAAARDHRPELFVGVGGGSAIDAAKGAILLLARGGRMEDHRGKRGSDEPLAPLIAVPTTAGTGTEMQSFALVARAEDHQKMACGDPGLAPRVALLDPELSTSMPRHVTACTGLDAVGHAVETAVTSARNPLSSLLAREAFRLLAGALPRALETPGDVPARGDALLGASYAGLAIEVSMLGGAHAMANPLTARFGVAHGQAVATALPHVVRHNAQDPEAARGYDGLAHAAGLEGGAEGVARLVEALLDLAGLPRRIGALGVPEEALDGLAAEAAEQWTARHNPRPLDAAALRGLYDAAFA